MTMNQYALFDDWREAEHARDTDAPIASTSEVRELAREHFNLPTPPDAEPPLLKARRHLRAEASGADRRGLVARWSRTFGFIEIHDPIEGEWWELPWKEAPSWARWEARKRKALHKSGDRRASERSSQDMEELWREEHPPEPEIGITEDHPVPE